MTIEDEARAQQMKSWEVTGEAWDAFNAEEFMTNGIQAVYDAGVRAGASRQPSEAEWTATLEALIADVYTILKPLAEGGTHASDSPIMKAYALLNAQDYEAARTARGER